jgi:hypothetical protein
VTITSGLKPVLGTAQATTSGTSKDWTDIPPGTKRITVSFADVSGSGTSEMLVQIGASGGIETTGYTSSGCRTTTTPGMELVTSTAGFIINNDAAANSVTGHMVLVLADAATNLWVGSHTTKANATTYFTGAGSKSLSGTLDRLRVTMVNGTDTFDAGSINIMYE